MTNRMLIMISLVLVAFAHGALSGSAEPQAKYNLTVRVNVSLPSPSQAQMPVRTSLLSAKLYFPKETARKPLLAYANYSGEFRFADLPGGSYLLEIYLGEKMLYQRVVSLPRDQTLEINLGDVKVVERTRLEQRHRRILDGPEFQGRVTVYVDDIHKNDPFAVIIFETGAERSKWTDQSRINSSTVRQTVPTSKRLFDGKLDPRSRLEADFVYQGQEYLLVGTVDTGIRDYLDFEVYRKAPREQQWRQKK